MLSTPQGSRLRPNQVIASSREGSALVISATSSSLRPSVWRNSRAACSANGKQTASALTVALTILRLSLRPLLISCTRALVGVGSLGGKIAPRGINNSSLTGHTNGVALFSADSFDEAFLNLAEFDHRQTAQRAYRRCALGPSA